MELQNQVSSLEPSKRLKELGVKQDSLWYWGWQSNPSSGKTECPKILYCPNESDKPTENHYDGECSAFTVTELGEMLPESILTIRPYQKNEWDYKPKDKWQCSICGKNGYCCMSDGFIDTNLTTEIANTEADARAKMLIYLIENMLVDVKKL